MENFREKAQLEEIKQRHKLEIEELKARQKANENYSKAIQEISKRLEKYNENSFIFTSKLFQKAKDDGYKESQDRLNFYKRR